MNKHEEKLEKIGEDTEDVSVVSVALPKVSSGYRPLHRRFGFWPATIEKCRNLPINQAVKIRLLPEENHVNFSCTAKKVARVKGFYLNAVYKYPFMYLWPDRMRGRVMPEDYNSKGAIFFDDEKEVEP
jgi:hypothetical protein